jgi:hypothetical protein
MMMTVVVDEIMIPEDSAALRFVRGMMFLVSRASKSIVLIY